ncbi:MAG: hypothetical protein KatS3mg073_1157 [Meiothermus sp.]|nr:MAG: hypothetical protein KatS3mg073_1157 [Meiothermus sp.]
MTYKAPQGPKTAKGWIQEAAKRMLLNNLDAEVAEKPEELIVYGGRGKAARSPQDLQRILAVLERLENDETLAGAVGPGGGGVQDTTHGSPGNHRQLQPGTQMGHLGGVRSA